MIPEDAKMRRQEAIANAKEQTQADDHFRQVKPEEKPMPYSDELFKEAVIQWLIETDQVYYVCLLWAIPLIGMLQPIAAFKYPSFQHMVHVASRATRGVQIPNWKQTRDKILSIFKTQMNKLKERLNVRIWHGIMYVYAVWLPL